MTWIHELGTQAVDNRIGEMEIFVGVVERGSFAAAASRMRLTPSAVSRSIARLEARLGLRLLQRTTRSLVPTDEGAAFYERASALLGDLGEIERSFTAEAAVPRGRLRVNANVPYGTALLVPLLPRFIERYPAMTIDLTLSDAVVDLLAERADVAIRFGPLRDSTLHARSLGHTSMVLVASPSYAKRHGLPARPDELERHRCIAFNFRRAHDSWPFLVGARGARGARSGKGGQVRQVRQYAVDAQLLGNSGDVVRQMALAGGGIARIGRFQVLEDLRRGRLVPVLERFNPGDTEEINALYVSQRHLALRIRAFVDFLAENATLDC